MIDSVFTTGKNYYQVFLEECKYIVKEKKMPEYITDNIEISNSDGEDSGEKNSNIENSNEENSN